MKLLKNHIILFDEDCPMCNLYAKKTIENGILEEEGKASYQQFSPESCPILDRQRAANEIALINQDTGEVSYGIESLFKILSHSFPALKPLFEFRPFAWLMQKLYAFIAFNRRVITPPAPSAKSFAWQPTFKLKYRIFYLLVTWLLTSVILTDYLSLISDLVPPASYRGYAICAGQLLFQGIVIFFYSRDKIWDYLGNLMTISCAGSLLFLPILMVSRFFNLSSLFFIVWFGLVFLLLFFEHIRRSKLLEIGWALTITWVLYHVLILIIIL